MAVGQDGNLARKTFFLVYRALPVKPGHGLWPWLLTAANIAEGFKKRGRADKARFLNIAQGSLEESRYYLILTKDLGYSECSELQTILTEVSKLLTAYSQAILNSDS